MKALRTLEGKEFTWHDVKAWLKANGYGDISDPDIYMNIASIRGVIKVGTKEVEGVKNAPVAYKFSRISKVKFGDGPQMGSEEDPL
jgi:hypothetical protein